MEANNAPPSQNAKVVIPLPEESENVTRWIVDQNFRRDQERLKIPFGKMTMKLKCMLNGSLFTHFVNHAMRGWWCGYLRLT